MQIVKETQAKFQWHCSYKWLS